MLTAFHPVPELVPELSPSYQFLVGRDCKNRSTSSFSNLIIDNHGSYHFLEVTARCFMKERVFRMRCAENSEHHVCCVSELIGDDKRKTLFIANPSSLTDCKGWFVGHCKIAAGQANYKQTDNATAGTCCVPFKRTTFGRPSRPGHNGQVVAVII